MGGANGGLTPQQAAAVQQASSFPFPVSAHMLNLAGFGNLSQQLNGANGLGGGFGPRTIDIKLLVLLSVTCMRWEGSGTSACMRCLVLFPGTDCDVRACNLRT